MQKHQLVSLVVYSDLQGLPIIKRVNTGLLLSEIRPHYSLLLHLPHPPRANKTPKEPNATARNGPLAKFPQPACATQLTSGFRHPRDQTPLPRMPNRKSDYTTLPCRRGIFSMFLSLKPISDIRLRVSRIFTEDISTFMVAEDEKTGGEYGRKRSQG